MILYASQRANAAELAKHLLNTKENDHVTVHEIRGFVSDDLAEALREAHAISRGTRCRQFLFSVSLNPPECADVPIEDFEAAIEEIERKLSLIGQPRIIVFHEKKGRRHCHVVWSRIDAAKLVAINMAHFKRKLMEVAHGLFLRHGWKLPKGMQKHEKRSPWHLTREEYRQAVRLAEDPQTLKAMLKGAWEQSDTKETFLRALEERGFLLAKGDRRGYVVLDVTGGVHIKAIEEKQQLTRTEARQKDVERKQIELSQYIRHYAEIQHKLETLQRKQDANRQFYAVVTHMSYSLNGLPRWDIRVQSPPQEKQLNEKAYVGRIQQLKNRELLHTITTTERPKPVIEPEIAAPNLRQSVLEAKEIMRRAGLQPGGDDSRSIAPVRIKITDTTALSTRFTQRRQ